MAETKAAKQRKRSAGILVYRMAGSGLEVFLVHPGGPFWKNKDAGAWSIAKGEYLEDEDPLAAALREFGEETGLTLPAGMLSLLGEIRQPSGKVVAAWALEADLPAHEAKSNLFSMEWPPKSGRMQEFPEVDRAEWFSVAEAREKLIAGQLGFLDRLIQMIKT
jgi:predicted NUDIX family NTP pyrophosphohydrolase